MKTNLISKSVMLAAMLGSASSAFAGGVLPGVDVGLSAGTLGAGPQIGWSIVPDRFDARVNIGYLSRSYDTTSDNVAYSGNLKLQNVGLLGDWHPWAGAFRLTGGLFYNGNKFDLTAQPAGGGTYTFNGNTYTAAQVGSASASVSFNSIAPYLGLGWGDGGTGAGLHFSSDIGVMYQGTPKASITATNPTGNAQLASDVQAAQAKLQSDLNSFRFYPVVQLGLVYRF